MKRVYERKGVELFKVCESEGYISLRRTSYTTRTDVGSCAIAWHFAAKRPWMTRHRRCTRRARVRRLFMMEVCCELSHLDTVGVVD